LSGFFAFSKQLAFFKEWTKRGTMFFWCSRLAREGKTPPYGAWSFS